MGFGNLENLFKLYTSSTLKSSTVCVLLKQTVNGMWAVPETLNRLVSLCGGLHVEAESNYSFYVWKNSFTQTYAAETTTLTLRSNLES